jgi:uncharacterized protein (TIGR02594 family)
MYSKRKTLTATAIVVAAVMIAVSQSPAEARRYKHVAAHKHAAVHEHAAKRYVAYRHSGKHARLPQRRVVASGVVYPFGDAAQIGAGMFSPWSQPSGSYAEGRRSQRVTKRATSPRAGKTAPFAANAGFGSSGLVTQARQYLGTNPTGMGALWCARFMNMVLEKSGRRGTGSNMANSFANYGTRVAGPQVGAIAVMSRGKRGGHVGIVSGIDASGNPIIISGNHNRRVAESVYPRGRIYAYVMP